MRQSEQIVKGIRGRRKCYSAEGKTRIVRLESAGHPDGAMRLSPTKLSALLEGLDWARVRWP